MDARLKRLLKRQIYIGTSSWKYEGWKGLIYQRPYRSEKAFKETCLEEYAEHFTAVGVDHTYYTWPTKKGFSRYAEQTPEEFKFGLKVTEAITVFHYPKLKRYGKHAGVKNETFLDPELFVEKFLTPLEGLESRLGPLMLEFSQFYPGWLSSGSEFVERLDRFFQRLPKSGFRYAVEMRNQNWLKPAYFECLSRNGVAHVFNSWTRMPPLPAQLETAQSFKPWSFVARLLLQPGTKYEEAVEAFAPYDKLVEVHPQLREGAVALIRRAIELGVPAHVFVNNRAEGSAPRTIEAILNLLDP